MSDLKPCPFCGGTFVVAGGDKNRDGVPRWRVMCNEGDCRMDVVTYDCDTRDEAVTIWNTRTMPEGGQT